MSHALATLDGHIAIICMQDQVRSQGTEGLSARVFHGEGYHSKGTCEQ